MLLTEQQRAHWNTLHSTNLTPEQLEQWVASIPGCPSCQKNFRSILKKNRPRYDDWERWTWEIHNAVNRKLAKTEVTWEDAARLWNWNPQHHLTEA